jgi:drug/metabolite transporter (DMT)-like permease
MLLLAFIWGSTFVLMEDATKWMPPLTFLTIRFFVAAFCLVIMVVFIYRVPMKCHSIWFLGSALGGLLALGFGLQTLSLQDTTSGNTAFFTSVVVVIVPFFSFFLLSTRLSVRSILSLILVLLGLFLLSGYQISNINQGDLLAFLGAFSFALHIVFIKKWGTKMPVFSLVTIQMIFAALFCGIGAFFFESWQSAFAPSVMIQPSVWSAIIVCSLLATVFAYAMQAYLQRYLDPNRASLIITMESVFAAGIDYLWNQVTITDWKLLGCVIIFAGLIWSNLKEEESTNNRVDMLTQEN